MTIPSYASVKDSSKLLKQTLAKTFPATKFSVRVSRGTAYGYASVSWTDGPTAIRVKEIIAMFEGSGFDGMTDSTYSKNAVMPNGLRSGLGIINYSRTISAKFAAMLIPVIANYYGLDQPQVKETSWGFELVGANDVMAHHQTGHYWGALIHQAASDRTRFLKK